MLESGDDHGGDVGHGDLPVKRVWPQRVAHHTGFLDRLAVPFPVVHEGGRAKDGPGLVERAHAGLDLPLAVEVGHAGVAVDGGGAGIDDVPDGRRSRRLGQVDALPLFGRDTGFEEILHGEQRGGALQGGVQRGAIFLIGARELGPALGQGLRRRLVGIAGQGPDGVAAVEQPPGDGTALLAGCAGDGDGTVVNLRFGHGLGSSYG